MPNATFVAVAAPPATSGSVIATSISAVASVDSVIDASTATSAAASTAASAAASANFASFISVSVTSASIAAASVGAISVVAAYVTVAYTLFLLQLFVLSALNRGADGASGVLEVARNNFWPPKLTSLTGSIVNLQSCLAVVAVRLKKKQPPSLLKS